MRALIVDDHEGFRSAARTLLELAGHEVVGEAQDGASAVAECRRLGPELVLLDVQLPDHNGFDIAVELRALDRSPAVVLVTARRVTADLARAAAAPVVGLIRKDELTPNALNDLFRGSA
jgi:DNA-binding NarL/FixJ family response regulator